MGSMWKWLCCCEEPDCPDLTPDDPSVLSCSGVPAIWRVDLNSPSLVSVDNCICQYIQGEFDLEIQEWSDVQTWYIDGLWTGVLPSYLEPNYPNSEQHCWWQYGVCTDDPFCRNWQGHPQLINILLFRKSYYDGFDWYWQWKLYLRPILWYDCAYTEPIAGGGYEYRSSWTQSTDCMEQADPVTGKIQLNFYAYHPYIGCTGSPPDPIYIWDAAA